MSFPTHEPLIRLQTEPIDTAACVDSVRDNAAGAVVLFLGTVREFTAGRQTSVLDYEAYTEMALDVMRRLDVETREKWPVVKSTIVHRLGRLELGEVSVAVAVSTPHRADAFQAGRYLIDELKVRVPIWKRETWANGEVKWVHPGLDAPVVRVASPETR
jgi:molybdopterin synthase catalytic subunit